MSLLLQLLTDAGLCAVCLNCSQLARLNVSNCEGLTDTTLKKLGAFCQQLRSELCHDQN